MARRLPAERRSALERAYLGEARGDHGAVLRRAVVDYVLRSPAQRARLGLQALEPVLAEVRPRLRHSAPLASRPALSSSWGSRAGCSGLQGSRRRASCAPVAWRESVDMARSALARRLQLLGGRALELSALWQDQGFASRRASSHAPWQSR